MISALIVALGAVLASYGTGLVLRHAPWLGLIDVPNDRSSHLRPTPRGGGIGIVAAVVSATTLLGAVGCVSLRWLGLVIVAGGLVAVTGLLDDRFSLPAGVKLVVHLVAAASALSVLDSPTSLLGPSAASRVLCFGLLAVGIAWHLNLFNFMDGIDGLAGAQGVFVGLSGAGLLGAYTDRGDLAWFLAGVAGASAGFLRWNWPPARIFMGDVGSGFLGYVLAIAAVATASEYPLSLWTWLILAAAFVVDATVTLVRRAGRGERLMSAHRSHGYQRLAQRWASHRRATLAYVAINMAGCLPVAWTSVLRPLWAPWLCLGLYLVLAVLFLAWGAGGREIVAVRGEGRDAQLLT